MIMKAKSQDLQWASRRTHGLSSSLKAGRLKTQEKPTFQFEIKGKKIKQCSSSSKQAGGIPSYSTFLFSSGHQSIGWGLPTLGRAICNY